jgi:glycosyltransferase involved in cell wall biosynthesis
MGIPPRVSIVITSCNQSKYIKQAILSALQQVYDNKEIILVDDGSTDGSLAIIEEFKQKNKVLSFPKPHSSGFARNRGIEAATGDFVLCLDGDDYIKPNYLSQTVPLMLRSPHIGVVYTDCLQYIEDVANFVYKHFQPFCRNMLLQYNFIHNGSLFRRKLALKVGLQNESLLLLEDYDFWLRLTTYSYAYYLPDALYVYRIHGRNKSLHNRREQKILMKKIASNYRKVIPVLIREEDHNQVYEVRNSIKYLIPSRQKFESLRYQWGHVVSVDPRLFRMYRS